MSADTIIEFSDPAGISSDPLTEVPRQGARSLPQNTVEAELADLLASHADQTDGLGRQRLVRPGHLPQREVMTGIGACAGEGSTGPRPR